MNPRQSRQTQQQTFQKQNQVQLSNKNSKLSTRINKKRNPITILLTLTQNYKKSTHKFHTNTKNSKMTTNDDESMPYEWIIHNINHLRKLQEQIVNIQWKTF